MVTIVKPPFPNVPKLPGVPQVLRNLQFPAAPPPIVGAVIAAGRLWQAFFGAPTWGIYKHQDAQPAVVDGIETVTSTAKRVPVVVPDSFLSFSYRNESSLPNYPIQDGAFANYNKVANPYEVALRMSKGGTKDDRVQFLKDCDTIQPTLDLYDVITPEKTYLNVNVVRLELVREGVRGAYFFAEVDIYLQEIRTVTQTYSNTSAGTQDAQNPSAEPVVNVGAVRAQPTTVTPDSVNIPSAGP